MSRRGDFCAAAGLFLLALLSAVPPAAVAQSGAPAAVPAPADAADPAAAMSAETAPLPRGFRGIELGMELETVKALLQKDPLFDYRGDPDIGFLPVPRQTLIECTGSSYLLRAYLQFEEGRLFVLILDLDPARVDWFTMYSTLKRKYGEAGRISPSDAVWSSTETRLSLERPLTIKYIDLPVFERIRREGQAREKLQDVSRERFLHEF